MTPTLDLRGVEKRFPVRDRGGFLDALQRKPVPQLVAVAGVDLTIHAGEAVGLVGESGCGKSTLARIASRLIEPDAGDIKLDGRDILSVPTSRFARSPDRRRIQMVFQDPTESLNPRFNVFDAIADPARQLLPGETRSAIADRVARIADSVGLPRELFSRYPHQLSGGQKARVGIARAMVVEPNLLVLDEPTSALDVSVQALVLKLLAKLRREAGVALLFVSHDLNVVRLLCDRIAVMYLGQIVETGPADAVFRTPAHPYSRALLSAIPRLPGQPRPPREYLEGEPKSPIDPDPNACRFYGRCSRQQDICARVAPQLDEVVASRSARCHFPIGAEPERAATNAGTKA